MIKGYTFDYQAVDAAADARLLRAMYNGQDGRLCGCELSFTRAGLRIEKGDFLACGRHLAFDEPIVVPTGAEPADSVYTRIFVRIDLSDEPAEDEFTQGRILLTSSPTYSELKPLVKEDINNGGSVYDIEIAIVKLDETQHITEIVRSWGIITPQKPELNSLKDLFNQSNANFHHLQTAVNDVNTTLLTNTNNVQSITTTVQQQQATITQMQAQLNSLLHLND